MKTITMDWDTYQKEIGNSQDRYEEGFKNGQLDYYYKKAPLFKFLIDVVEGKIQMDLNKLRQLREEAGEL